ncbi:MAG: hypothetical protein Q8829_02940, partial [Candidatus Phytoplasma australasiaticum]|nr:hypothetical protein [Candidatus Phytoplasma australasiaticum]
MLNLLLLLLHLLLHHYHLLLHQMGHLVQSVISLSLKVAVGGFSSGLSFWCHYDQKFFNNIEELLKQIIKYAKKSLEKTPELL